MQHLYLYVSLKIQDVQMGYLLPRSNANSFFSDRSLSDLILRIETEILVGLCCYVYRFYVESM